MSENRPDPDHPRGEELNRRELIRRIAVGSAFALPVIASFDMSSLGVSSAYANTPNQSIPPAFQSPNSATFTVGEHLTFAVWVTGGGPVNVTKDGKLPDGVKFTAITDNYEDDNDCDATLSGKPAPGTGGIYPITLHATNYTTPTEATQKFRLYVNEAIAFTSAAKATVTVGREASVKLATSGFPTPEITHAGKLPRGMSFKADPAKGTATISGKPQETGVFKLKLHASNHITRAASQEFVLTVKS